MEVASLVTNSSELIEKFRYFIENREDLMFSAQDNSIISWKSRATGEIQLYYHLDCNVEEEFSYNFSENEVKAIRAFSGDRIYIVDISFKNKQIFDRMLVDFITSLGLDRSSDKLLIHDPFTGLLIPKNNTLIPFDLNESFNQ